MTCGTNPSHHLPTFAPIGGNFGPLLSTEINTTLRAITRPEPLQSSTFRGHCSVLPCSVRGEARSHNDDSVNRTGRPS
jgi:hypothetical protein